MRDQSIYWVATRQYPNGHRSKHLEKGFKSFSSLESSQNFLLKSRLNC